MEKLDPTFLDLIGYFSELCQLQGGFKWVTVFKNGPSKICGREA